MQDRVGRIAPGLRADFAIWDIEHPAELAYAVGANPCVSRHRAAAAS
jgi:imidazolonepropionase